MAPKIDTRRRALLALAASVIVLGACASTGGSESPATTAAPTTTANPTTATANTVGGHEGHDGEMTSTDRATAMLATAAFQDVDVAEAAGYASTIDVLGCFQDPRGGMGVHYLNESLMDDQVDLARPEALVYELDADARVAGLVAHEYIVPIEAWHESTPPELAGRAFHQHPTLPLWVLHTWLWKDDPTGVFQDWNPAVRLCPAGVPIFGRDLPEPAPTTTAAPQGSTSGSSAMGATGDTRFGPY